MQKEINYLEQIIIIVAVVVCFIWWFNRGEDNDVKSIKDYFVEAISNSGISPAWVSPKRKKRVNKKEELCRGILEKTFGVPFPTVRPDWLVNPDTGKCLELDAYNSELNLALEYDGEQHYKFVPIFHKTPSDLNKQIERDAYKTRICKLHGIRLIRVPYWIEEEDLEEYILNQAKRVVTSPENRF